ncbi:MAG: GNAT family N-acetyltransferase [Aggregatilineales bacterium]
MATQDPTIVIIRRATSADIPALSDLIARFVETGDLLPRLNDELEDLIETCFIADKNGQLVGCAALEIYSRKLAEIRSLAVSPDVQGMGVGKRLVQACVDLAMEHNIFEVMAISAEDNFFTSCGFDYTLPRLRKAFFLQTRDDL